MGVGRGGGVCVVQKLETLLVVELPCGWDVDVWAVWERGGEVDEGVGGWVEIVGCVSVFVVVAFCTSGERAGVARGKEKNGVSSKDRTHTHTHTHTHTIYIYIVAGHCT